MKEHIQKAGLKHWYGDYLVDLQKEPLDALQALLEPLGSCILTGCEVTANGSNWDISAGVIAVRHNTDGFKVVRTAAVTNTTLPGYFTCAANTTQGNYNSGTDDVYTTYSGTFTAGSPGAINDESLIIPSQTAPAPPLTKLVQALGNAAISEEVEVPATLFGASPGSLKFRVNFLSRTLHIYGTIQVQNYAALNENPLELNNSLVLPEYMRPAVKQYFFGFPPANTSYAITDNNDKDYIRSVPLFVGIDGKITIYLIKANPSYGTQYPLEVNAVVSLV